MLPLGLSSDDQRAFHEALVSSHRVFHRVSLMDLEHRHLADLSDMLDDGQVDLIAGGNEATRSCTLTLFDPHRRSTLDGASEGTAGVFADRMLRVTRSTWVASLDRWIDVPLFTGPVVKVERSGHTLSVECHGKESLANQPIWKARVWAKGLTRVGVCRSLLQETGETKFDFPSVGDKSARLPKPLALTWESKPWQHVLILARSMKWQAFFDGRGVARLRAYYQKPVWLFLDGDGGSVLSTPEVGPNTEEDGIVNTFKVIGAKPSIWFTAKLPAWHARSPWTLGRNGKLRHLPIVEENSDVRTKEEARKVAEAMRDDHMNDPGKITFEGLVIPHVEPMDVIRINAGGVAQTARLREASFSLRSGTATYGYTRNLRRARGRFRSWS